MLIDKNYILERICSLIKEKQAGQTPPSAAPSKLKKQLFVLRFYLPMWVRYCIRTILLNPFRCIRSGCREYRQLQRQHSNSIVRYNGFNVLAADFVQYCLKQDLHFDTHRFFAPEYDAFVQKHIDERIKCVLGYAPRPITSEEAAYRSADCNLQKHIKIRRELHWLAYEGKEYGLAHRRFGAGLWFYHYGLKNLPDKVKSYIAGKDFLDVGAGIGDSALMLLEYNPRRIYAYEPMTYDHRSLLKAIAGNGVQDRVVAIKKGLGEREGVIDLNICCGASSMLEGFVAGGRTEQVAIATIDNECRDKTIGIIKMDIEGFEYYAIKGGLDTIKRDKPVMLISIYHTGKDFFEIPPMLKDAVPEYRFKLVDTAPGGITEKILVAYI